jgi:hypothetical protein
MKTLPLGGSEVGHGLNTFDAPKFIVSRGDMQGGSVIHSRLMWLFMEKVVSRAAMASTLAKDTQERVNLLL